MDEKKRARFWVVSAFLCVLFLCATHAGAALVSLAGSDVTFTFNDSNLGLFGAPQVQGNTLYFLPTDFTARSLNGQGYHLTRDTINVLVQTKSSDLSFGSINLYEQGDYFQLGPGTSVGVGGALIGTNPANPSTDRVWNFIASPTDLGITGFPTNIWEAYADLNLADKGWNRVIVTVQNILYAGTTDNPSIAFVEKKYTALSASTIPIPGAAWLLGAGLIGLVAVRRRRR